MSETENVASNEAENTIPKENENAAPTLEMIETELEKEEHKHNFRRVLRSTVYALVIVAAVTVLVVVLVFPILQITGTSMAETLRDGDIVLSMNKGDYKAGDIVAFYYGNDNNILVKRIIAVEGDWIDMDGAGNVSVNGEALDEPYVTELAVGYCDMTFPYQVPSGKKFLMGDNRETSMDSRVSAIGCVDDERIVGKILFCVWPLTDFGWAH